MAGKNILAALCLTPKLLRSFRAPIIVLHIGIAYLSVDNFTNRFGPFGQKKPYHFTYRPYSIIYSKKGPLKMAKFVFT